MSRHAVALLLPEDLWRTILGPETAGVLLEACGVPVRSHRVRGTRVIHEPLTESVLVVLEHPGYPEVAAGAQPPRYGPNAPELVPALRFRESFTYTAADARAGRPFPGARRGA